MTQKSLFPKTLTEKEVQRQCILLLMHSGYLVLRINSGSMMINKRLFRAYIVENNGKSAGMSDLLALKGNRALLIEVKKGKGGKLSRNQNEFIELAERCGVKVHVVKDLEELENILKDEK